VVLSRGGAVEREDGNPEGIESSSPGLRGTSYPGSANGIEL